MATTLLDDVTGFMASRSLSDAATKLNEPEGAIFRGYQAASAAVLGALAGKAGDSNFTSQAFDLIKSTFSGGKILDAEGYGDQFPVADNTTEAGRLKNRRIAVRVVEL